MASDQKMHLGMSPITKRIYLGKQRNEMWSGPKRDVTNEFIQVMLQKFDTKEVFEITNDGNPDRKLIIVDHDTKVTINGKEY